MEVQFGPNSVDQPNLLYKLQRKIKVFNATSPLPNRGYNLVASTSKYGIVFVATPDGTLSVYYLKDLIDKEVEPKHLVVKLSEKPTHIAISCDQELLAVTGGQLLCVYRVTDFQNQNVSPSLSIKYDVNPSTFVSALQWNPCIPDTIAIAFFDGTLLVSQVTSAQVKKVQSKARCICWSPKGKQLVTGNNDGTLAQYKPDLTPAKMIPPPNLFEGAPVEALAIYWISTFQFAVVYKNAADNSRPALTIVNTPKAGQPSCLNYEDICYSLGSNRPWYYYLHGLAQWNMILCSSSNSMEIATLGSTDGAHWLQWCQPDEARPELPLTDKKQENYPVGLCIDTCAIHQLPWGENDTLPHMPLLHIVSQTGLLTIFNVINLNKDAPQLCTPTQQLALPAAAMSSNILEDAPPQPTPVQAAPVAQPKPQPVPQQPQAPQPSQSAFALPSSYFDSLSSKPYQPQAQPQPQQNYPAASLPPVSEQKQEVKPVINIPQPQAAPVQPKPQTPAAKPPPQAQQVNAALKAEQERMNKMKADQELKNMLVNEVNGFQMELHKFVVKTREMQIKLQHDINSMNPNFSFQLLDTVKLKKECSLDELRGAIIELKLELVRACAVVAEARTHTDAKDLHQWTQADPLTTKRVASVKKLAYYVQTQLEQAHRALDYKWNEMALKDPQFNKSGQRMIRPVLDDIYQPLVKQQEILSRQQAVLKTLRNTLKECDTMPMFKSTTLLRSTPFRNKDPLSKLTKNILNMSIEPQANKPKEPLLTPQKLDSLRDLLSNHKPVKIKPVNVELRQHLVAMRLSYENSVKQKAREPRQEAIQSAHEQPVQEPMQAPLQSDLPVNFMKQEPKPDLISKQMPISVPSFTPLGNAKPNIPGLSNVARTLFTDEPKLESPKPQAKIPAPQPQIQRQQPQNLLQQQQIHSQQPKIQPQQPKIQVQQSQMQPPAPMPVKPASTVTANTRSVLKDMLQNKQANAEAKSDSNTFMGQKICSPTAFAFSSPAQSASPLNTPTTVSFTSKPITDINNMFNKFTPQTFSAEPKQIATKPKSDETGEPESTNTPKLVATPKEDKQLTNLFGMTTSTPLPPSSQAVPDVLKSNTFVTVRTENKTSKPIEKVPVKLKENVPEKSNENVSQETQQASEDKKENGSKPLSITATNSKPSIFATATTTVTTTASITISSDSHKPAESKDESTPEPHEEANKSETQKALSPSSSASSLFAAANAASPTEIKPQPLFGLPSSPTPSSQPTSIFGTENLTQPATTSAKSETATTKESTLATNTSVSASFIFGTAVASQAQTTSSSSIFASAASAAFGTSASQGSIFGTTDPTTTQSSSTPIFGTSTTQSVFSSIASAKPSVFSSPTPASPSSVFATTSASPVFGSSPTSVFAAAATQASVFGSSTSPVFGGTTTAQSTSIFATTPTTAQSVFGNAATTTQSIFGTTTATTQSSIFGSATATTPSVFGAATPTTTQSSIFGTAAASPTSVFGSPTPTTQTSVFGATTQASIFGSATTTTQASIFGSTSPTTTQASIFGAPQTTQASVFGTPPTTTAQSGSLFGGVDTNLFAAASISTTSAPSPTSGGNIFGGGSSGSVFGSGSSTNLFGGKSTFGQSNPTPASIFGGGASFGQKPTTNFWSGGGATAGSGFGTTGFGQQATTQASSIFGGGTGGSFSAPSGGQPFGSPQQSSPFGGQQQAASGFGGSAVFASKPAFGQSTGFGSPTSGGGFGSSFGGFNKSPSSGFGAPAAFGGGASFGGSAFGNTSPGKGFGSTAVPGFGTPTQSNATFENLATQNTLTFGNLAQQSGQPAPQPAPTFNTSPSFTGWRG